MQCRAPDLVGGPAQIGYGAALQNFTVELLHQCRKGMVCRQLGNLGQNLAAGVRRLFPARLLHIPPHTGGGAYSPWHTSRKPTLVKASWDRFRDDTPRHRAALSSGSADYRREICKVLVRRAAMALAKEG